MGSSKKHKEKHRKKKRDRSRSGSRNSDEYRDRGRNRSRSPIRREERREDDRKSDDFYKKTSRKSEEFRDMDDRQRDRDYQEEVERQRLLKQEKKRRKGNESPDPRSEAGMEGREEGAKQHGSGDMSLSIQETNKLRAKLGLKPLKVDGERNENEEVSYDDRPDVHVPAQNISSVKKADSLKDKMEEIKEKRRIHKKLQRVTTLGKDVDPAAESASAWVEKMRKQEEEKRLAQKRAKMLEELDDEFGVSGMINEALGQPPKKAPIKKEPRYSSKDLAGLKIEHSGGEITDGSSVIVTLKDKGILEDDEDVLQNVNLVENRAAVRNIENRKKRPGYVAYDEVDEETGIFKVKGILDKYNEEIDGREEKFIRIDASGVGDLEDEYEIDRIRKNLKAQQMTLAVDAPQLATDYFTQEEMVQFKKPRKKRKVRKREIVKADDLLPLADDARPDHGTKKKPKGIMKSSSDRGDDMDVDEKPNEESLDLEEEREFLRRMQALENAPVEEDEAELELQMALARSRKAKVKKEPDEISAPEKLVERILASNEEESRKQEKRKAKSGAIVLDSTSEFCRTLGELPSMGHTHDIKEEEEDEDQEMEVTGGWEQVVVSEKKEKPSEQKHEAVLEEEPDLKVGVGAALKVALMKGLIDAEKKKVLNTGPTNLPKTKAVVDEEKMREEERDRGRRAYDRDRYDPYAFKEKDTYKPEVKLEYVDEHGRPLNEKEAFRFLSHRFHGKGSGKMKSEKRAKKVAEEMKMKKMSAIDTPLNTAQMMIDRQQLSQTPYVVLSGGGKNLLNTNIISKK